MHFNRELFLHICIIGFSDGALIALIALGYTLVYGIVELINFAHGEVFMMGAFWPRRSIGLDRRHRRQSSAFAIVGMALLAFVGAMVFSATYQLGHRPGRLPAVAQRAAVGAVDLRDRLQFHLAASRHLLERLEPVFAAVADSRRVPQRTTF